MTVPHIHPNNMIMDARKHRVAKTSILDLLVISKHWITQQKGLVKYTVVHPKNEKLLSNEKQYMLTNVETFPKTIPMKDRVSQITYKAWYWCT